VEQLWGHTGYAQQVHFGAGATNRLAQLLRDTGARSWMLVTSEGRAQSDDGQRVAQLLGRALTATCAEARPGLPASAVEAGVRQARRDSVDGVVSFGGGACADLAKAVCFFLEQEAGTPGTSYADRPVVAHVTVPTTYSGIGIVPWFAMTDPVTRRTRTAGGPTLAPIAVVCDPEVASSSPRVIAATGMAAVAAAVEAACSPAHSPEAEAIALDCVRRATAALPGAVDDAADVEGRAALLEASVLAGRASLNAATGLQHLLGLLVAIRCGIPYGVAAAILLPHVMRFNADAVPDQHHRVGLAVGDPDDPAGAVQRLAERLGLPTGLLEAGVDPTELEAVASLAAADPSLRANPRPAGEADVRAILDDAC